MPDPGVDVWAASRWSSRHCRRNVAGSVSDGRVVEAGT